VGRSRDSPKNISREPRRYAPCGALEWALTEKKEGITVVKGCKQLAEVLVVGTKRKREPTFPAKKQSVRVGKRGVLPKGDVWGRGVEGGRREGALSQSCEGGNGGKRAVG